MIDRLTLLVRIAARNLLASPINLLIGGLLFFGTIVFVVVGGLLDSVNQSMARSVVGSVAGHVQIYSAKSKDELALFGQMGLAAMTEFPKPSWVLFPVGFITIAITAISIIPSFLAARLKPITAMGHVG